MTEKETLIKILEAILSELPQYRNVNVLGLFQFDTMKGFTNGIAEIDNVKIKNILIKVKMILDMEF